MKSLSLVALILAPWLCLAQTEPTPEQIAKFKEARQKLVEGLKPQKGEITLPGGIAKVSVPESLSYLDGNDAETVLTKIWGNPPDKEKPLGMLIPKDKSPIDDDVWAVLIEFEDSGYVKDDDAAKLNYDDLLKTMQKSSVAENKEREKLGYDRVDLVGWATKPHYDSAAKKIYWAKELKFGGAEENTLNYNIRILGRRGVLNLNAIASIHQLADIEKETSTILSAVDFSEGHRYADFKPGSDKIATYGLAGLIAGGVLLKSGAAKGILALLLAGKKFVVIGVVALAAFVKKLFGRNEPTA